MNEVSDLQKVFDWITSHWAFCAFIIGMIFEVPKWRFRPFTALFKWIGKRINNPVMEEIGRVDTKVDDLKVEMKTEIDSLKADMKEMRRVHDADEMDSVRSTVLDFANSCRHGRSHTKEEFDHIKALNDKYESLLKKYDIKNGVYESDYDFILEEDKRCKRENAYLA